MAVASKESDNGVVEFQFQKRENRTKWQSVQKAIYDSEKKEFLGRTGKSWGQLLVFYTIFYIILAALFAICMQGLFASLDEQEPRWTLDSSLIGTNPGLGFRPISPKTEEGSLISYSVTNFTTILKWKNLTDEFLKPYYKKQVGENYMNCNFTKYPDSGKVCITDIDAEFKNCNRENFYGFNSTSPCVILKLNRIFNWEPDFYTEPHEDMDEGLAEHIRNLPVDHRRQIWVTCNGEDDVDKEMVTQFEYFPRGFAGYYYPYKNVENYLSPLLAVKIVNPKPNVVISIECRAWAKNIKYIGGNLHRAGSVKFEVMVDSKEEVKITTPEETTVNISTTSLPN